MTHIDASDHTEREGYVANLETGNFENNLQTTNCSDRYLKNGFQIERSWTAAYFIMILLLLYRYY